MNGRHRGRMERSQQTERNISWLSSETSPSRTTPIRARSRRSRLTPRPPSPGRKEGRTVPGLPGLRRQGGNRGSVVDHEQGGQRLHLGQSRRSELPGTDFLPPDRIGQRSLPHLVPLTKTKPRRLTPAGLSLLHPAYPKSVRPAELHGRVLSSFRPFPGPFPAA